MAAAPPPKRQRVSSASSSAGVDGKHPTSAPLSLSPHANTTSAPASHPFSFPGVYSQSSRLCHVCGGKPTDGGRQGHGLKLHRGGRQWSQFCSAFGLVFHKGARVCCCCLKFVHGLNVRDAPCTATGPPDRLPALSAKQVAELGHDVSVWTYFRHTHILAGCRCAL